MEVDYPSEIHKLLKIGSNSHEPDFDLPTASENHTNEHVQAYNTYEYSISHEQASKADFGEKIKNALVYPVIFLVAFAFFYLALNFSSVAAQIGGLFTKPQDQQILGDELNAYYKWIQNYYYAVSDNKLLDPNNDIDKDGASNYDEFIMQTNPILSDSDSDGFSDGTEFINKTNPWGSGGMTKQQLKQAENLDLIMMNNRISFNSLPTDKQIAQNDIVENYDLSKPGKLSIPKLNLQVPLVWSKDPADFDADLTRGVIHYPGTALPSEIGTIYVSGHSSDYFWKQGDFKDVFARLNRLSPGDDIFVDVYGLDGEVYNYRYQVAGSNVYKPADQAQFFDNSDVSKINLSTCWPIGTQKDRLVVSATQVGL